MGQIKKGDHVKDSFRRSEFGIFLSDPIQDEADDRVLASELKVFTFLIGAINSTNTKR